MLSNILNQCLNNTTCSSPQVENNTVVIAKGDSGASTHYIRPQDKNILTNIKNHEGPAVTQPDGTDLNITGTGELPLHASLSKAAKQGHILPNLSSSSLIALGPLCDDGCIVVLTDKNLLAVKEKNVVLRGYRNRFDDLWDIPLHPHTKCMNNVKLPQTHAALYIPPHRRNQPPEDKINNFVANKLPSLIKNIPKENFKIKSMKRKKVNRKK